MRRGFTILEITFSVGILSIVILGTLASVHFGMRSQQHGRNLAEAGSYAARLLEVMVEENRAFASVSLPTSTSGFQDAADVRQALDASPFNSSSYGLPSGSRFKRNISVIACRAVSESGTQYGWKDDLRQVTVTIYWWENQRERSVSLRCYSKLAR
ncbi:MAG: type II secretion system protein [Vulcanimicrobiota bacterium]